MGEHILDLFGLVGSGGFFSEIFPIAKEVVAKEQSTTKLVNVVRSQIEPKANPNRKQTLEEIEDTIFLKLNNKRWFNIAIADSVLRKSLSIRFEENGCKAKSLISKKSLIYDNALIGKGAIIMPFSTVSANSEIGSFFHCNFNSYIAHDTVIGNFVTVSPNVCCCANVVIEDEVFIGASSVIINGDPENKIIIGKGAIVGAGSVVTKSVLPGSKVYGNPARIRKLEL